MSPTNVLKIVSWKAFKKTMTVLPAVFFLLLGAHTSHAKWEVEYSDWLIGAMRDQGIFRSKRAGSFATRNECEKVRRDAVIQSGDPSLDMHTKCVGFDEPSYQAQPSPSPSHPGETQQDALHYRSRHQEDRSEKERRDEEERQQEAYLKQKEDLLRRLKGSPSQSAGIKTPSAGIRKLELKTYSGTGGKTAGGALKQLESVAGSSEEARATDDLEAARKQSEFKVRPHGGIPVESVRVPDVPAPTLTAAQIQARDHITRTRETLVSELMETQNKLEKTRERTEKTKEDIAAKKEEIIKIDKRFNHPRYKKEFLVVKKDNAAKELDDLEKLALELEREATQLNDNADQQRRKYEELNKQEKDVLNNPEHAEEYMRQMR
ncbi:MAG: hypothetical protein KGZ49_13285 [Syntrophaceae bacterium]|nr:hypothetical protein [Syntrophaceae bacterium]